MSNAMMFSIGLTILVSLFTIVVGIDALNQHFKRVTRFLTVVNNIASALKARKNRFFSLPWVTLFPMKADTLTTMRLVGIVVSLTAFVEGKSALAISAFVCSWFFDLLDGPKSIAEARSRTSPSPAAPKYDIDIGGYPTWYGKYLDPFFDVICFALIAWQLWDFYPRWLVKTFTGAIVVRVSLYLLLFACHHTWAKRLPPLLPKSLAGEYKTVFIFVSGFLIIVWRTSETALQLAAVTLGIALILEGGSLLEQIWRAAMLLRRPVPKPAIVPFDRTGSD
ncbi:MAG: hypothetical protein HY975_03710 [Candidatus Kerfeldbacteria bacterium]|nr:hypothetical protein [Candidatus Kerfeldbacteria bacterium]